jgi:hypothetical protein
MKLRNAWRIALGTVGGVMALSGCAEGTLERADDVQSRDNPFPSQLTFTRGAITGSGELPPHTLRPREPASALDAGWSDAADATDAATPVDAAVPQDAAPYATPDAGQGH